MILFVFPEASFCSSSSGSKVASKNMWKLFYSGGFSLFIKHIMEKLKREKLVLGPTIFPSALSFLYYCL